MSTTSKLKMSYKCGNCETVRHIDEQGWVAECSYCGDEEYNLFDLPTEEEIYRNIHGIGKRWMSTTSKTCRALYLFWCNTINKANFIAQDWKQFGWRYAIYQGAWIHFKSGGKLCKMIRHNYEDIGCTNYMACTRCLKKAEISEYNYWDVDLYPTLWFLCTKCNGMGRGPYTESCTACHEIGLRYGWLRWLERVKNSAARFMESIPASLRCCDECKKIKIVFGRYVGNHDGCLPF